jgi:hypothetical protein
VRAALEETKALTDSRGGKSSQNTKLQFACEPIRGKYPSVTMQAEGYPAGLFVSRTGCMTNACILPLRIIRINTLATGRVHGG